MFIARTIGADGCLTVYDIQEEAIRGELWDPHPELVLSVAKQRCSRVPACTRTAQTPRRGWSRRWRRRSGHG